MGGGCKGEYVFGGKGRTVILPMGFSSDDASWSHFLNDLHVGGIGPGSSGGAGMEGLSPSGLSGETKRTLDELKACGCRLAIGSSSKNAKYILGRLGLADYFDAVSDGNNIRRSKPDPQVFTMAEGFLGLSSGECLVVEDAISGIDAAIAGGFDSAGIGEAAKPYSS